MELQHANNKAYCLSYKYYIHVHIVLFQMDFREKDIRLSQTKRRRVIYSPINSNTNLHIDFSKMEIV